MKIDPHFPRKEMLIFTGVTAFILLAAATVPLNIIAAIGSGFLLVFVMALEYEILMRVFTSISGEGNEFYNPQIMGLTAIVIMIAYKIQSKLHPKHPVVVLIKALSFISIATYLLGVGLIFASYMGMDLRPLLPTSGGGFPIPGQEPTLNPSKLLDYVFDYVINPSSVLIFSIGISGVALLNLFVASHLMQWVFTNFVKAFKKKQIAEKATGWFSNIKATNKQLIELEYDLGDALIDDVEAINEQVADDFILVRDAALEEWKKQVAWKDLNIMSKYTDLDEADIPGIRKYLKSLDAITREDVLKELDSPQSTTLPRR